MQRVQGRRCQKLGNYYATSAGTVMSKTRELLCDECRDGDVKNSGIISGRCWDGMSKLVEYGQRQGMSEICGDGKVCLLTGDQWEETQGLAAMGQCQGWQSQWEQRRDVWLQRERLSDKVGSKRGSGCWHRMSDPGCKSMLRRSTCCEMQAAVLQIN
jgi:hypothetical protein